MRRQIIILGMLLLFALPVVGQEWPDSFIGDHMPDSSSPSNIVMFVHSTVNANPQTGRWYRTVWFGPDCDSVPIALLDITMYKDQGASVSAPVVYQIPWNDVMQSYSFSGSVGDGKYNIITMNVTNPSDLKLILGTYRINTQGEMGWAKDYPIYVYRIVPDIKIHREGRRVE